MRERPCDKCNYMMNDNGQGFYMCTKCYHTYTDPDAVTFAELAAAVAEWDEYARQPWGNGGLVNENYCRTREEWEEMMEEAGMRLHTLAARIREGEKR